MITILFVEDEGLVRMITAESLRDAGFDVVEAADGDEAIKLLNAFNFFDILLTDVRMPGSLDGLQVAFHARRLHPNIPVVVVSGYAPHLMTRLRTLDPAAVYIGKPYKLEKIVETIKRMTTSP